MIRNISKGQKIAGIALTMLLSIAFIDRAAAQLTVSTNKTAAELASSLVGAGVTVSNATLNCPGGSNGTFSTASSPLSIPGGIVLTSGSASAVSSSSGTFTSVDVSTSGDPDLTALAGYTTNDGCVLEFDFTSTGDSIRFRYQFGSEEYPDYTCSPFNDVFGFFISGGTEYPTPTNIALVPGTTIPVAINSINSGTASTNYVIGTCQAMGSGSPFPAYFIDNTTSSIPPVYDGLTVALTAKAAVTPCSTYHLKLGIADGTDHILDSGVFLEEGSLTVLPPVITGCPSDININTTAACDQTATWTPPTVAGNCLGYTEVHTNSPGDVFPVGTTTVTYTFTNAGGSSTCSFNVTVTDVTTCNITVTPSSNVCTNGQPTDIFLGYGPQSATMTASVNGGASGYTYSWSPATDLSDPNIANPVFTPSAPGTYMYTVTATHPNGCTTTCSVTFCVRDVRVPGTDGNKIYVCHIPPDNPANAHTIAVSINAVPNHVCLHGGDKLGQCGEECNAAGAKRTPTPIATKSLEIIASPNPFVNDLHIRILSNEFDAADIAIYDATGKLIERRTAQPVSTDLVIGKNLVPGVYVVEVTQGGVSEKTKVVKMQ